MELYELSYAYIRRKRFEAQMLAAELAKLLVGTGSRANTSKQPDDRVPADQLLAEMGVTIQ